MRRLALAILGVVTALVGGAIWFAGWAWVDAGQSPAGRDTLIGAPAIVLLALLGYLVLSRFPANRIGMAMAAIALCGGGLAFADAYATYALLVDGGSDVPGASYAAWAANWLWVPVIMCPITLVLLLAPAGTLVSRRWRPVLILDLVALSLLSGTQMLQPGDLEDFPGTHNPFGLNQLELVLMPLNLAGFLLLLPGVLLSAASLIVRFRGSEGRERLQLKWLAAAAGTVAALFAASWAVSLASYDIWDYTSMAALCLVPGASAVAILKHRLYDIDVIINRALVYGSLTAGTVASYAALVVALGWLARAATGQEGNEVVVAATTLVVAALFQPARRAIQSLVDRRFYRAKYDAARILEGFQARLRDELDIESLQRELVSTAHRALQPETAGVWLRPPVLREAGVR